MTKLRIHLASGKSVDVAFEEDLDIEDTIDALASDIDSAGRPHWHVIGSVLVYTQNIQAIEAL